jgi:hypothetical protein
LRGRVSGEVLEERGGGRGNGGADLWDVGSVGVWGVLFGVEVGVGNVRVGLPDSKFEIRFQYVVMFWSGEKNTVLPHCVPPNGRIS